MQGPPFLIWTMQRTGCTNLADRLRDFSTRGTWPQEPLTPGKVHGAITDRFEADGDADRLARDVKALVSARKNIKHCIDAVPPAVSEALAKAALAERYRHLFVHRSDAVARLMSLSYAHRSNQWEAGTGDAPDPEVFEPPLPAPQLAALEIAMAHRYNTLSHWLFERDAPVLSVAYEDIYLAEAGVAAETVGQILAHLHLPVDPRDARRAAALIRARGRHGPQDRYASFKGRARLESMLKLKPDYVKGSPTPLL